VAGAHAASWLKNPHARIVSIGDLHKERAEQLAGRLGLDCAIRNDFDAYRTHELCLAIDRSSAEGGRPVRLLLE
jgi:predicted dehydrogenase